MTDRQPIDTEAALAAAWEADRASRVEASLWESLKQTAIQVRADNHFRHTWAREIRRWKGPNDAA